MTQFLPDNLLKLFAPRPPIPYLPPVAEVTVEKKRPRIQGLAQFLPQFETVTPPPVPKVHIETKEEKRQRWVCAELLAIITGEYFREKKKKNS